MSDEFTQDRITRDRDDPNYALGEEAVFSIELAPGASNAHVCLSNDGYQILLQQPLHDTSARIRGALHEPGVLRCRINWIRDDKPQSMICAAVYDPLHIEPTTTEPEDFDAFWQSQKATLAQIALDTQTESAATDDAERDVGFSKVSLANLDSTRVYGYFAKPSSDGPFPAILTLQNHGGGA